MQNTELNHKIAQIVFMTEQCFAVQDTYGKTPSQLKTLMKVMIEDLQQYKLDNIEAAFRQWRRAESKVPTVRGIIAIIEHDLRHVARMRELTAPIVREERTPPTAEERAAVSEMVQQCARLLKGGHHEEQRQSDSGGEDSDRASG